MKFRFTLIFALLFLFTSPIYSQVKNKAIKENVKKENKMQKRNINKADQTTKVEDKKESNDKVRSGVAQPGVYTEEISSTSFVVTQVATAIPAFIGYTEKVTSNPTSIKSMTEYMNAFGGPSHEEIGEFEIETNGNIISPIISNTPKYKMYYMLNMFFANGGRECFIISVGHYNDQPNAVKNNEMLTGLNKLNQ